jgi:hypothetical protein
MINEASKDGKILNFRTKNIAMFYNIVMEEKEHGKSF